MYMYVCQYTCSCSGTTCVIITLRFTFSTGATNSYMLWPPCSHPYFPRQEGHQYAYHHVQPQPHFAPSMPHCWRSMCISTKNHTNYYKLCISVGGHLKERCIGKWGGGYSLVPRLSWGKGKESLITTACTCQNLHKLTMDYSESHGSPTLKPPVRSKKVLSSNSDGFD